MKKIIFLIFVSFFLAACADQTITFKGEVHRGEVTYQYEIPGDTTTGTYEVLVDSGGWAGASVKEINHSERVLTDASGRYELQIKVPRKLGYPSAESFTIQAWAPSGVSSRDEKISYYVHARPGETVYVRPFLLVYHTNEETEPVQ
ncbi:MAG: hypothetical protein J7L54_02815 [Elusimicrobia bacterium]|nr:hypothetical protein [Elusimicrobiota bacterium]